MDIDKVFKNIGAQYKTTNSASFHYDVTDWNVEFDRIRNVCTLKAFAPIAFSEESYSSLTDVIEKMNSEQKLGYYRLVKKTKTEPSGLELKLMLWVDKNKPTAASLADLLDTIGAEMNSTVLLIKRLEAQN